MCRGTIQISGSNWKSLIWESQLRRAMISLSHIIMPISHPLSSFFLVYCCILLPVCDNLSLPDTRYFVPNLSHLIAGIRADYFLNRDLINSCDGQEAGYKNHLILVSSWNRLTFHTKMKTLSAIWKIYRALNSLSLFSYYLLLFRKNWPTVVRLNQSRSQRILWLLEELNLKYELETYKRRADGQAPPELKEIHPLGKSPILKIESEATSQPLVLAESGFIIEYLIDHYGNRLVPKRFIEGKDGQVGGETEEWIRYRYFMHYAEGSLMPYLVIGVLFNSKLPI